MLFDVKAAVADIRSQDLPSANTAKFAKRPASARAQLAGIAEIAATSCNLPKIDTSIPEAVPGDCNHGFAAGKRPKTWTGKIVSLADWRVLSDWERHGPNGRLWNGQTKGWEDPK